MTVFVDEDFFDGDIPPCDRVWDYMIEKGYDQYFEREVKFHDGSFQPKRRLWRFDFGSAQWKLAIEIEGKIWHKGRHTRGSGFIKDCVKYNTAALMGWRVLRFPTDWVKDQSYKDMIDLAVQICLGKDKDDV